MSADALIRAIEGLAVRVAALEQKQASFARVSSVKSVDPSAGTVQVEIAPGQNSPDIPYTQQGGSLAVHAPPSVGQEMLLIAPGGDIRNAIAIPAAYGGGNVRPGSDAATNAIRFGGVTITLSDGQVTIDGADLIVTGGDVVADGISLKAHTHPHGDPAGNTSAPN